MYLSYFPANQQWAFTLGTTLVRLYNAYNESMPLFYATRVGAFDAARVCGLAIGKRNVVSVA